MAILTVSCSGSGGGGTTGPPAGGPVVTALTPSQAEIGDQVTISGSGFGTTPGAVTVRFRGTAAQVVSVTPAAITAVVPVIAPGAAAVGVTVSGSAAADAAFTVLQSPVLITSVSPVPFRAGEEITITGEGFLEPVGALVPAGERLSVTLTSVETQQIEELPIHRASFTEIVALVPGVVAPGTWEVDVQVGDLDGSAGPPVASLLPQLLHSFAADGTIVANAFNALPLGLQTTYDFTLRETSFDRSTGTGTVEAILNGFTHIDGTFDAATGAFDLGGPVTANSTWFFNGGLAPDPDGSMTVTGANLRIVDQNNAELQFRYDLAISWRNNVTLTAKLDVSLGHLVNGNGALPAGDYEYTSWDPVSWDPLPAFHGELEGAWFQSQNPENHVGTFTGTLRSFYDDFTFGGVTWKSIHTYITPLNSSQDVTLTGFDLGSSQVARQTFAPVDNVGILNRERYELSGGIRHVDAVPAGNGFTAYSHVGALFIEQGSEAFAGERLMYRFR